VTINGANLANASSVTFNGTPATTFTVNTPVKITATVPAGATTGLIAVTTTPGGTATSATNFTVRLTPTISGFSPVIGGVGVRVTIDGANFSGATSVKLNGIAAAFTVNSAGTQITTTVPGNGTTGQIAVTTPGGTATSTTSFTVAPRITSFTPVNGVIGTGVTINGANFTGASTVTFNGTGATPFTVNSSIKITATVPPGATTGKIAVTTPAGTATSAGSFAVKPAISGFDPGNGGAGAQVTITGTGFTGATSVRINGFAAAFTGNSTQITMTVPGNATSGPITVTTPGGTATSATSFTVAPRITSFSPAHGGIGASVAINGANFTGATSVTFNGIAATNRVVNSAVKITATVPTNASTGPIAVTTPGGTATSTNNFTIP
jgi:hypothetical protein